MLQSLLGPYETCVPEMKGYVFHEALSLSYGVAVIPIFPNEKTKV